MEGKVVVSKTITLRKGDNILPVNISNLSNGIYLVEFVDALSGKKTTTKIIKQ
jgi:hypothetical protein